MADLSVYVHFPWCLRKCPYCDFATSPLALDQIPHELYADAVLRELRARGPALEGHRLWSVFFGGGTPSLFRPDQLGRVVAGICEAFASHAPEVEITAECNPSSLDLERARALMDAGVNRLSVGVQSLDDAELQFLGRLHDRTSALRALDAAQTACGRVSADLMFALPEQPPERFYGYVDTLLSRGLSHVSAYALTIEPATRFGELSRKGLLQAAPDESYATMFEGIHQRFAAQGLAHYEVSNYARPGEESRHNQHYWRGEAYVGLGAAAVGCLHTGPGRARRYRNHPDPTRYMERAGTAEVEVFEESLGSRDMVREALMLGLRTTEGVDLDALETRAGESALVGREPSVKRLMQRGHLRIERGVMTVPLERWLLLDGIVAELF